MSDLTLADTLAAQMVPATATPRTLELQRLMDDMARASEAANLSARVACSHLLAGDIESAEARARRSEAAAVHADELSAQLTAELAR